MEPKKNPKIDAGRNSSLYFSLGLICALLLSFVVLQTEFKETNFTISKNDPIEEHDIFQPDFNTEINIIPEKVKKTQQITDIINVVENLPTPEVENPTPSIDTPSQGVTQGTTQPIVDARHIDTPVSQDEDIELPFLLIEDVPIFPGCEKLSKDQHRKCFEKKLKDHVMKHQRFPQQAIGNGLNGKVNAQFIIDETGQVKVAYMRSTHPMFEKEVQRVLNLLPKMIPGKQRLKPVKVSYAMPFSFVLQ